MKTNPRLSIETVLKPGGQAAISVACRFEQCSRTSITYCHILRTLSTITAINLEVGFSVPAFH